MPDFKIIKQAVQQQMDVMAMGPLFRTGVEKDLLWDTYLSSFPEGSNPIFKERTEHDCQCCKQFIRQAGAMVTINSDLTLSSIWDIQVDDEAYQTVADSLSALVKSQPVQNIFLHYERDIGADKNRSLLESGDVKVWEHFHYSLPEHGFARGGLDSLLGHCRTDKEMYHRGVSTISEQACDTVIELIDQGSLYRGEENLARVKAFAAECKAFTDVSRDKADNFCWSRSRDNSELSRIRNTSIGVLLVDLSEGMDLEQAVSKFESMVAPANYKRPTALVTPAMIAQAQEKVAELGLSSALERRYAVVEDVSVNDVLFADRTVKPAMNVFEEISNSTAVKTPAMGKVEEVTAEVFVEKILPKAESLEVMLENRHSANLFSLIAPADKNCRPMFKWDNNFSWAYKGDVTDSMKERVKSAGGRVDGVLRFSIQWNDGDNNQNDFDAHCVEPGGNVIFYPKKGQVQPSSGILDVDIQRPGNAVAVENITWSDKNSMREGEYIFQVHNFSHNGGTTGFTAEIEYEGHIYAYTYAKGLRQNEKVQVAKINFSRSEGVRIIESLPHSQMSKELWGLATQRFSKVSMVMNSPNHWDGQQTGNKHLFFVLEGCANPEPGRGFFNEFLRGELHPHRKVFEILGSRMKTPESEDQLSGLGFSSTQRNSVLCKVSGSFNRTVKVQF